MLLFAALGLFSLKRCISYLSPWKTLKTNQSDPIRAQLVWKFKENCCMIPVWSIKLLLWLLRYLISSEQTPLPPFYNESSDYTTRLWLRTLWAVVLLLAYISLTSLQNIPQILICLDAFTLYAKFSPSHTDKRFLYSTMTRFASSAADCFFFFRMDSPTRTFPIRPPVFVAICSTVMKSVKENCGLLSGVDDIIAGEGNKVPLLRPSFVPNFQHLHLPLLTSEFSF